MRLLPLILVLTLLAGCGPSGAPDKGAPAGGPPGGAPPAEVTVFVVTPQLLPLDFEYVGRAAGSRETEVRARVTGLLLARNFEEGARVKKGQSMYSIDPAPYQIAAAKAEAEVAAAEARLDQARRNVARLKPLVAEKAVSRKDHDDAVSAEAIGGADLKAARARLADARLSLGYTTVEAAVSGISGRSQRAEGSLISGPEALLTTVTQVDPIWVNFGIPDSDQAKMQKDALAGRLVMPKDGDFAVSLRLADGTLFPQTGRVSFADLRISPATGTREARAELPNPDGALRPGQFVRVILKGATLPNAASVPQRAVLESPQGGKFVYVVDEKNTAQVRPVEAGEWSAQRWIITSGLKAGERVIVDGVMKIGPGAPVRIAEKPLPARK